MKLADWKAEQLKKWGLEDNGLFEWRVISKKSERAFVQGEGNTGELSDMAMIELRIGDKLILTDAVDVPSLEDGDEFFDVQSVKLAAEKARADALAAELEALKAAIAEAVA